MAAQKQDNQLERTFSSYVRIQDVVLKTYLGRWTIGRSGERGSGISVLPVRYDDDDDSALLESIIPSSENHQQHHDTCNNGNTFTSYRVAFKNGLVHFLFLWKLQIKWRRHVIFWPFDPAKNAIPRWCTGRKWHIPMASNRKRSRGQIKADNMGQGEGPTVPL